MPACPDISQYLVRNLAIERGFLLSFGAGSDSLFCIAAPFDQPFAVGRKLVQALLLVAVQPRDRFGKGIELALKLVTFILQCCVLLHLFKQVRLKLGFLSQLELLPIIVEPLGLSLHLLLLAPSIVDLGARFIDLRALLACGLQPRTRTNRLRRRIEVISTSTGVGDLPGEVLIIVDDEVVKAEVIALAPLRRAEIRRVSGSSI